MTRFLLAFLKLPMIVDAYQANTFEAVGSVLCSHCAGYLMHLIIHSGGGGRSSVIPAFDNRVRKLTDERQNKWGLSFLRKRPICPSIHHGQASTSLYRNMQKLVSHGKSNGRKMASCAVSLQRRCRAVSSFSCIQESKPTE